MVSNIWSVSGTTFQKALSERKSVLMFSQNNVFVCDSTRRLCVAVARLLWASEYVYCSSDSV